MKFSIITATFAFLALLCVLPAFLFGILAAGEAEARGRGRARKRQVFLIGLAAFFALLAAETFATTRSS